MAAVAVTAGSHYRMRKRSGGVPNTARQVRASADEAQRLTLGSCRTGARQVETGA